MNQSDSPSITNSKDENTGYVKDFGVSKNQDEQKEIMIDKKYNFVIIGFGDLGKGWHQLLTEAGQNVYVCSLELKRIYGGLFT